MGFVNKVLLMGNLTRDPELRQLPSGSAVCEIGIAVNRTYKTASGEEKQEAVFVDCTAFGRTGEVIAEYCEQGRPLFVEGRLHYETWEDKTGNRRNKLSVIVESFQFVGGGDNAERKDHAKPAQNPHQQGAYNAAKASTNRNKRQAPADASMRAQPQGGYGGEDAGPSDADDLPF